MNERLHIFAIFSCLYIFSVLSEHTVQYTDKKENKIFLIHKEIQSGAVAKSYMRKGFLIYEEMQKYFPYMGRPLVIYDFAYVPFCSSYMRKI